MSAIKINILLCDTFPGLLPDTIPSYTSMFIDLFNSVSTNINYCVFNTYANELPATINKNEIYLITGSNSGAYESKEWIKSLLSFIRRADSEKALLAGICFGHQAIAQALGGKVEPSEKGWGTGIRKSYIVSNAAKTYFSSENLFLHYNHHDQVINLPPGAIRFATSDFCPNEGFTIGNHILTFQGHPEYTDAYNCHLIENHSDNESEKVKKAALESIALYHAMGREAATWITDLIKK